MAQQSPTDPERPRATRPFPSGGGGHCGLRPLLLGQRKEMDTAAKQDEPPMDPTYQLPAGRREPLNNG